MNNFNRSVRQVLGGDLKSSSVQTIQVNLGLLCNLSCRHCHVEASPKRTEIMSWETIQGVLRLVRALPGVQVDLTGGAPELNPNFRSMIKLLRESGCPVQVRTNLTVLFEPGQTDTPEFLARHGVQLVASLPCYLDENVDTQRGPGTYKQSIAAMRRLNALGYGQSKELPLNLVYNPGGAFLPPEQAPLEDDYRRELKARYGVEFSRLLTITNMPLGRFLHDLKKDGRAENYQSLLQESFNPETIHGLMCRHQISVAWDGTLADCDFNSALGLSLVEDLPQHVDQLEPQRLLQRRIVTDNHCFGCTAGCGSSCGGALVA